MTAEENNKCVGWLNNLEKNKNLIKTGSFPKLNYIQLHTYCIIYSQYKRVKSVDIFICQLLKEYTMAIT